MTRVVAREQAALESQVVSRAPVTQNIDHPVEFVF
jgi:hypothetical protein